MTRASDPVVCENPGRVRIFGKLAYRRRRRTCRWRILNRAAKTPARIHDCGDAAWPERVLRDNVSLRDREPEWRSIGRPREARTSRRLAARPLRSGRDRRLIQPTRVGLPAIPVDTRPRAVVRRARFRCQPAQPRVRAIAVKVPLELKRASAPGPWPSRTASGRDIRGGSCQSGVRRTDATGTRTARS
jgi:hypothetical protein